MIFKNIVVGLILLLYGIMFGIESTTYTIGNLDSIGPGFYPLVSSILLSICGLILVVRGVSK